MGPEQTDLFVMLSPRHEWKSGRSKADIVTTLQNELADIPGIRPSFSQPIALRVNELISGVKSDLAVKIFGPDIETLKSFADRTAAKLSNIRGAHDVKVEQVSGMEQIEVELNRREMARFGINVSGVNELLESAIAGKAATIAIDGQRRISTVVRFPAGEQTNIEDLKQLLLRGATGEIVPLARIARIALVEGPAQISDWRLPTDFELLTIIDYGQYSPAIHAYYFLYTQSDFYWSSVVSASGTPASWAVSFSGGQVFGFQNDTFGYHYYSRCVRSSKAVVGDFIDNGNGTVTDNVTNLMWQKQDDGATHTWEQALSYCEGLTLAELSDWRLPNIKELKTIADMTRYNPAINSVYFPSIQLSQYWSSTTATGNSTYAWLSILTTVSCLTTIKQTHILFGASVNGDPVLSH